MRGTVLMTQDPIGFGTMPADASELWTLSRLLLTSWAEGVTLSSAWKTDIVAARTAAERRQGMVSKPSRVQSWTMRSLSRREAWMLMNALVRQAVARTMIPLYCDQTKTTADVLTGDTSIPCDTTFRRLFPGAGVIIGRPAATAAGWGPECDLFEVRQIATVAAGALTLTTGLATGYPAGSKVWPMIETEIAGTGSATVTTDHVLELRASMREVRGVSCLPGVAEWDDFTPDPSLITTTVDSPIQLRRHDFGQQAQWGVSRDLLSVSTGLTELYELKGARPRSTTKQSLHFLSREDAWQMIGLFDTCQGALRKFWTVAPIATHTIVDISTTQVMVKLSGPVSDWDLWPAIAIIKRDPYPRIRRIASVSRASGIDTITFADPFSVISLSECRYLTVAMPARFTSDEMTEQWVTSQQCQIDYEAEELLEEKEVAI